MLISECSLPHCAWLSGMLIVFLITSEKKNGLCGWPARYLSWSYSGLVACFPMLIWPILESVFDKLVTKMHLCVVIWGIKSCIWESNVSVIKLPYSLICKLFWKLSTLGAAEPNSMSSVWLAIQTKSPSSGLADWEFNTCVCTEVQDSPLSMRG